VRSRFPGDQQRLARMSLIEEGSERKVRMANLAIVGSHSTNGVAAIHSELLRKDNRPRLREMLPQRFNNKTNGVTPRRWLLQCNPALAGTITDAIGDGWITDLTSSRAQAARRRQGFRDAFRMPSVRPRRSCRLAQGDVGLSVDPDTIFDCQVKRIHEYKRQLLNALRIVVLYNRLRENPSSTSRRGRSSSPARPRPRTTWRRSSSSSSTTSPRRSTAIPPSRPHQGRLPARLSRDAGRATDPRRDVSNQISTAGYEASGTSNMKFMMNGALTIGTRDGATIEMAQEAGEENFFSSV
jgi:starch phosphorylase